MLAQVDKVVPKDRASHEQDSDNFQDESERRLPTKQVIDECHEVADDNEDDIDDRDTMRQRTMWEIAVEIDEAR